MEITFRGALRALKSIRLALVLIVLLVAGGAAASLIPQGRPPEYYGGHFPKLVAQLVLAAGFDRYFSSALFLLPALGLFVNLSACTLARFLGQLRRSQGRRFGPDVLHLGLLVLLVGAVLTFSGRQEGSVSLRPGDQVELPGGYLLRLLDFTYLKYEDGRPRDWISRVRVEKDGRAVEESFDIRVNQALSVGSIKIYQSSHGQEEQLALKDSRGTELLLARGERVALEGAAAVFMAVEGELAVVNWRDASGSSVRRIRAGDRLGGYESGGMRLVSFTGLQAVSDPGYPVVAAGFVLLLAGLSMTFARKLAEKKEA